MPIDSAASLLFNIGADTSDAEANVQRFRALLGKDLGDLSGEFSDWSTKVFGDLTTVEGAMTALAATTVAGVIGLGAAMAHFADKQADYVEQVERGSRASGISTEHMSGLKLMAEETGTQYDSLVTGLTRFATTIVKAADGSQAQMHAFAQLHISQEQVKAGEKDMMPLLELVADRFQALGSQVERTAVARELFSRGGASLVRMLSLGSAGMKEFEQEAEKLGLTVHAQDVVAMEEFRATSKATEAEMQALSNEIGKIALPIWENFKIGVLVTAIALKDLPHAIHGDFWATLKKDVGEAGDRINVLSHALATLPAAGEGMDDLAPKAKKLKDNFSGLSELLDEVNRKTEATALGESGRLQAEFDELNEKLVKVYTSYRELHAAGKLTAEDAKEQAAALALLPGALKALHDALQGQADTKQAEAVQRTGTELRELILREGQQTLAVKEQLLELEMKQRREALQEEGKDTAENLALLGELELAGRKKIADEREAELDREAADRARAEAKAAADAEAARVAGDQEIARLGEQLERIEKKHETSQERIEAQYDADVAKFDAAEEKKTLAAFTGEAERAAIMAGFAAIRKGLTDKEQQDLQALWNSQGWRGIFGDEFTRDIQRNEQLMKEWATSSNQSLLMVKVALESMDEMAQKAFQQMAQGMGAGIAHAMIYEKSIGAAMKAAMVATLESLAGQAYAHAIYSLALGFLDLATGDEAGAVAAFEAAALFAAVGTASALIGRAMGPGTGAGGGSSTSQPSQTSQQAAASRDQQLGRWARRAGRAGRM